MPPTTKLPLPSPSQTRTLLRSFSSSTRTPAPHASTSTNAPSLPKSRSLDASNAVSAGPTLSTQQQDPLFHPKPHLHPSSLSFSTSASTSTSSSSSSAPINTSQPSPLPTPPQLPPRRRPNYQPSGAGLAGDQDRARRRNGWKGLKGRIGAGVAEALNGGTSGLADSASTVAAGTEDSSSVNAAVGGEGDEVLLQSSSGAGPSKVRVTGTGKEVEQVDGGVEMSEILGLNRGKKRGEFGAEEAVGGVGGKSASGEEAEACYVISRLTLMITATPLHPLLPLPLPLPLTYSPHPLPHYTLAYETWGTLSPNRDNCILLHTGLSASSHVASGGNGVAEEVRGRKGWWEDFVGPGKAIDTDRFFVICTNVLGGCFGSTGPSSQWPHGEEGARWATRFPTLSLFDMLRAQLSLLDHLGIEKLYASVGSSMGGMQCLALAYLAPERVGRVASISATGRSGLGGVGMRFAQRSVLMSDPNWNRGFYYDGVPPHAGMKLARQIATITYRSGPEWEQRFGRKMLSETEDEEGKRVVGVPALSPDFLIETYLDHQGERFCLTYDANSMIYLSKAMDLFDMTEDILISLSNKFKSAYPDDTQAFPHPWDGVADGTHEQIEASSVIGPVSTRAGKDKKKYKAPFIPTSKSPHLASLAKGLARLQNIPALVLGVQSDILFPVEQQRELADALKLAGNQQVSYYELGGVWGHDTFLLDVQSVGGAIRGFLH